MASEADSLEKIPFTCDTVANPLPVRLLLLLIRLTVLALGIGRRGTPSMGIKESQFIENWVKFDTWALKKKYGVFKKIMEEIFCLNIWALNLNMVFQS